MKCEHCGTEFNGEGMTCPGCGQISNVGHTTVGAPGTVGPARANGSHEVRNSSTPQSERTAPVLTNPGRPRGEVIEGAGG